MNRSSGQSSGTSATGTSGSGSGGSQSAHASGSHSHGGDLLCKVKYLNTLPDIPFDPKFIAYPFDPNRFIKYNSTSLEKKFQMGYFM